jgi:BirA family transcriptional regulator, biotin operon repressor / biotin---[acetyl-CoA-carboxylase] ligase
LKSNPSDPPPGEIPEALVEAIARARPRLGRLASTLLYFPAIGSTNDIALAFSTSAEPPPSKKGSYPFSGPVAGEKGYDPFFDPPASAQRPDGLVVVADEQTAGRGRRGHAWFSPPGSGLYASVVLAPATARVDPLRATRLLTLAAGVALAEGIHAATSLSVSLKWPNDLLVARRKLAGILAEATDRLVVVGYGINVAAAAFPPELHDRATSLESELGRPVDRYRVLVETLAALSRRYEDLLDGRFDAILDAWRRHAPAASGARVTWTTMEGTQSGVTAGIDDQGALLVQVGDRVERIVSGEVRWL